MVISLIFVIFIVVHFASFLVRVTLVLIPFTILGKFYFIWGCSITTLLRHGLFACKLDVWNISSCDPAGCQVNSSGYERWRQRLGCIVGLCFQDAHAFNGDISGLDVSSFFRVLTPSTTTSVACMCRRSMLQCAHAFNGDISGLDVS